MRFHWKPSERSLGPLTCAKQPWSIPLGRADATPEPAVLPVYDGEHILIAGPSRSGRSTTLTALGQQLLCAEAAPTVFGIALRPSPLRGLRGTTVATTPGEAAALLAEAGGCQRLEPIVILFDDAEVLGDLKRL